MLRVIALCAATGILAGCRAPSPNGTAPPRAAIEAHADPSVDVYGPYAVVKLPLTEGVVVWNPTQIETGPDGFMYVANKGGEIYSLRDTDGDGLEDTARLFCDVRDDGLVSPTSLAFRGNELYVGTAQAIRAYADVDGDGTADTSRTVFDDIPFSEHPYEYTSALTFAGDGSLYFALTTDSWNAGASPDPGGLRGSIMRLAADGADPERFATGIRSVHGMAFGPESDLIFVDNEGGGNPTEELNVAKRDAFYGHNPGKYGSPATTGPLHSIWTELAPAGITFNPPDNAFGGTAGDLFVALYGPGERWQRGGVARIRFHRADDGSIRAEEFPVATGLAKVSDVAFGPDGDLYVTQVGVTDYWYQGLEGSDGAVYRLIEVPWATGLPPDSARALAAPVPAESRDRGEQLFADLACSACHAVDGTTERLGPNLKDIALTYNRDELLEEIEEPSKRIKPSMTSTRITRTNGEVILGRVIASSEGDVSVIGIGNIVTRIPRAEIASTEDVLQSMMYTGLLNGVTEEGKDDLLAYLTSLSGPP